MNPDISKKTSQRKGFLILELQKQEFSRLIWGKKTFEAEEMQYTNHRRYKGGVYVHVQNGQGL